MKILGFEHANLKFNDGNSVSGYFLYLHDDESESAKKVTGIKTERLFMSDKKIGQYIPKVGDRVRILWNRYGKADSIELVRS